MIKTASTREIIEKLKAYEKMYGIGSVISIGSVSSGSRDIEYVFPFFSTSNTLTGKFPCIHLLNLLKCA